MTMQALTRDAAAAPGLPAAWAALPWRNQGSVRPMPLKPPSRNIWRRLIASWRLLQCGDMV
jgi:hypothetical protein